MDTWRIYTSVDGSYSMDDGHDNIVWSGYNILHTYPVNGVGSFLLTESVSETNPSANC